jgi:hypothetical protein
VIKSQSGTGDKTIQAEIDKVLETAQQYIACVFMASDVDASCNDCHQQFLDFWGSGFETFDLDLALANGEDDMSKTEAAS